MKDKDLAYLSAAVYDDRDRFAEQCSQIGASLAHFFDNEGTQAALVQGPDSAAIVFRGTEASAWKWRDIWSNVTWPWPTSWQGRGRVHSGYRRHLSYIGHEALQMAKTVSSSVPLHVAGHSLGGAIGTIFTSLYFHANPHYKLRGLITFGAPKAANREACSAISCPVRRYAVTGDFAPHWPPVPGLGHPVPATWLPPRRRWHGAMKRHDADGYTAALAERGV